MEYLFAAYAVVGVGVFAYLGYVGNQLKDLQRQLDDVPQRQVKPVQPGPPG